MKDKQSPIITERDLAARLERIAANLIPSENSHPTQRNRGNNIDIKGLTSHYNTSKLSKIASMVVLESNPQLHRAIEILAGFIVNPDGTESTELYYDADIPNVQGEVKVSKEEVTKVVEYIRTHFTSNKPIHKKLADMVYNILATDGADVELYVPESFVTNLINPSNESAIKNHKFFDVAGEGAETKTTLLDGSVLIDSDHNTLFRDITYGRMRNHIGNEAAKNNGKIDIDRVLAMRKVLKESPVVEIVESDNKESRFSTYVKDVPAEACVPVICGSDIENPVFYYILLDDAGQFVRVRETVDFEKEMREAAARDKDGTNSLLASISSDFGNRNAQKSNISDVNPDALYEQFSQQLEEKMLDAIKTGKYGDTYTLEHDNHLVEVMLHRALKKKKTKVIAVPASMISYIAFDRNSSGVGISVVMKSKMLTVLQSVLFYATYMGYLDQAIPKEVIEATFDEADTDQRQTRDMIMQEFISDSSEVFSYANGNPVELMNKLKRRGVQFKYQNTQTGDLPAMDINREMVRRERNEPDTTFLEMLSNQTTQTTGISPQWVSDSYTPNFKAEIVRDNELIRRQIQKSVDKLEEGLTDRVIKNILNDPILTQNCLSLIKGKKDDESAEKKLMAILTYFTITLPSPPELGEDINIEAVENYANVLDVILEAIVNEGIIDGLEEMDSRKIESLRANMKAYFMVDFVRSNTKFREVVDSLRDKEKLDSIIDSESDSAKLIIAAAGDMAKFILRQDSKTKEKLDKVREGTADEPEATPETPVEETEATETPEEETGGDETGDGNVPGLPDLPEL